MSTSTSEKVLVWDLPVRVFHWLLVLSFAGAWLTAESERWRQVHVTLGYTMAGLVAFRVVWGLAGSRYARFNSFVRGPSATLRYFKSLFGTRPERHLGHNPAGAVAIVGLLLLILTTAGTGWAALNDWGSGWLEEGHEIAANALLALVIVHLLGVAFGCFLHRENLVRSMLTGRKYVTKVITGSPETSGIARSWSILGAAVLAAVLAFWAWQWQQQPDAVTTVTAGDVGKHQTRHGEDD